MARPVASFDGGAMAGDERKYKEKSLVEAPYHRDVNWLTTSLVILRKVVITIAIYYPSRIFVALCHTRF